VAYVPSFAVMVPVDWPELAGFTLTEIPTIGSPCTSVTVPCTDTPAARATSASAVSLSAITVTLSAEPESMVAVVPPQASNASNDPAVHVENSYAGRAGHRIEPLIAPLGFDWKMGIGIVASFAAREVFR